MQQGGDAGRTLEWGVMNQLGKLNHQNNDFCMAILARIISLLQRFTRILGICQPSPHSRYQSMHKIMHLPIFLHMIFPPHRRLAASPLHPRPLITPQPPHPSSRPVCPRRPSTRAHKAPRRPVFQTCGAPFLTRAARACSQSLYAKMNITRNATAATHMSGLTSLARPRATMMKQ